MLLNFGLAVVETAKRLTGAALALVAEQGGELITRRFG